MYYVYLLRCKDDTLYCGTAADWEKRLRIHFSGSSHAARYTRAHPPLRPEAVWQCGSKGDALRLEYLIKQLSREEKIRLIDGLTKENEKAFPEAIRLPDSALVSSDGLW